MTESSEKEQSVVNKDDTKESKGSYVSDQIISILFPIVALWHGPKYLIKGEYLKGIIILAIFAIELYFIFSINS